MLDLVGNREDRVVAHITLETIFLYRCFKRQDKDTKDAVNKVIKRQFKELGFIS